MPDCAISASRPSGLQSDGLAAGIWPGNDELPPFSFEFELTGTTATFFSFEIPLQQRMSGR